MVRINFSLPADYRSGTAVRVKLFFLSDQNCTALFPLEYGARARPGLAAFEGLGGLTLKGGHAVVLKTGVVTTKTIEVRPTASFPGQKRGDYIGLNFTRKADDVGDTCTSFFALLHGEVRYTTR
jgi:hypothetical protein